MDIKNIAGKTAYYANRLTDVRFLGQALFVVLVLLISWSGIKAIQTNYSLQKEISRLRQQNDVMRLENENLALKNRYFNSDQYLELAARQNFGLAAPGEKIIVVPKNVALSYTVDLPSDKPPGPKSKRPAYQRNFESWVNFFLHRQSLKDKPAD
ncbi:MAG TPA: septum formation initiator family protein [Candidatus Saccharimonadales bacterium]|nr:septum formation initiator family protein [Candidatus Saccharimonadales bacterium]